MKDSREKKYIPRIRISKITSNEEVEEEITVEGQNAIVFYEAAKIIEQLWDKEYHMEIGKILEVARMLG